LSITSVVILAHALVGIVFVVGLLGRWIVLGLAAGADDLPTMRTLTAAAGPFERIVIVGSTVVLVLGIAAAFVAGRSVLGPFTGGHVDWLFVSVLLFLSNIPLVPLVFIPRGRIFGAVLADAERAGTVTPELRAAWADPVTRAAHVYELATVTIVLCLMLTKPF
jgi:hypothetical protein